MSQILASFSPLNCLFFGSFLLAAQKNEQQKRFGKIDFKEKKRIYSYHFLSPPPFLSPLSFGDAKERGTKSGRNQTEMADCGEAGYVNIFHNQLSVIV